MKLLILVLTVCTIAAAAPKITKEETFDPVSEISQNDRSILVNILIRQLIAYVRSIINNGSEVFGIPPLDPLELNHFHLVLPTGLLKLSQYALPSLTGSYLLSGWVLGKALASLTAELMGQLDSNKDHTHLDLELRNVLVTGIGAFVVHRSNLRLSDLTFDLDISVPKLDASAELYDLTGNLFNAIPLYGNGKAIFQVEEFRFKAKLFLRQSDDGKSVIIDRIEEASFDLPNFKSDLSGAIGGGDIDPIVNAVIEEVIVGYINRFERVISKTVSEAIVKSANPLLNQLDTWRYIAMLL